MCKRLVTLVVLSLAGMLLTVTLTVAPAGAWPAGTTYFVDPAGNNGHTCLAPAPATACQTIGGALAKAAAAGDTIVVAAGTYHEHLTVGKSVTIDGAGAGSTILDGSATDRVVTVNAGMNVVLSNLTIENGKTSGVGGGILNNGTLALNNSVVTTNTAALGGGIFNTHGLSLTSSSVLTNAAAYGGGIYNFGPLFGFATATLANSVVRGNTVITDGGGIYNSGVIVGSAVLTLQNNSLISDNTAAAGGGGGIYNLDGMLSLASSGVSFNASGGTAALTGGGGVYNGPNGDMVVTSSNVQSNSAINLGGGVYNRGTGDAFNVLVGTNALSGIDGLGGGLNNEGQLTFDHSQLTGNTAFAGGGLFNNGATTITLSLINGNSARHGVSPGYGGGVYEQHGTLNVEASTISDNTSGPGGGIYNTSGKTSVVDSTISGNQGGDAGGIWNFGIGATLIMTNTTVSYNQASVDGGGILSDRSVSLNNVTVAFNVAGNLNSGGGVYVPLTSTAVLTSVNTIIADNQAGAAPDCFGSIASLGFNLLGNNLNCDFHAQATDLVGTANGPIDPLLDGLAPNGNPNRPLTDALFVGSPAINSGSPLISPDPTACASHDERGIVRPVGPGCDMGAFQGAIALFRAYLPLVRR